MFFSTQVADCVEPFCLAACGSEIGVCTTYNLLRNTEKICFFTSVIFFDLDLEVQLFFSVEDLEMNLEVLQEVL